MKRRTLRAWFWLAYATAIMFLIVLFTGCTLQRPSAMETGWLLVHTLDTAQTVTIARSPDCLYERAPLARMAYGTRHPSVSRVLVTNAVGGLIHWQASSFLERQPRHWTRYGFYAVSIFASGSAVVGNYRLGIEPARGNMCETRKTEVRP